ncbi:hypothetical protein TREPR_0287 [Treponema primitia ZAS-2]|uniref:Uncharacterized protein n=1 Tax=Treponema primitia (strain ATCC BAA-887 / DSM 12427 / ZAS-2) TaxID=545694 RepID=F5YNW5_TREPZ|nr:hypothetical protein [Treponema primitia]AEF85393.1 hypothetical protein TREPR_0287 [Treponema primitia ZAS-2]
MRKRWIFPIFFAIFFYLGSCAGGPSLTDIQDKEWKLVEVRIDPADLSRDTILFDRAKLKTEGLDDIFTLTIHTAGVNGKAAPEAYTASYDQGDSQAFSLKQMNITPAEKSLAPERLREAEFFAFLEKVKRWELIQDRLELYSATPDGISAILIFINK